MFESLEGKAAGHGTGAILEAVGELKHDRLRVANELLVWTAAWADAHPVETIMESGPGLAQAVRPGGDGTPAVNDLAMAELSAKLGKSSAAGLTFIGEVLDLRHRLPLLWAKVVRCEVEEWQARKVARLTHHLSQDHAADVDRAIARIAGSQPYGKLVDTVEANVLRVDGARAREQYEERRKQRGVWKSQTDDNGLTGIYARLDPHVARTVDGRIQEIADCMTEGTVDERRAAAFGLFGDTAAITRLRAQTTPTGPVRRRTR